MRSRPTTPVALLLVVLVLLTAPASARAARHYRIKIIDAANQPLACVQLTTTNQVVYTSDDNGFVAFYEPGLMGQDVWFTPSRPGYTFAKDWLGSVGAKLHVSEGGTGTIQSTDAPSPPPPRPAGCLGGSSETSLLLADVPGLGQSFVLRFVDAKSGRPLPLVEVRTSRRSLVSDSAGVVAFHDPQVMGQAVEFTVHAHGYTVAGTNPRVLTAAPGGSTSWSLEPKPEQIAERLYRMTGGGIYRDSVLLGLAVPLLQPVLNAMVLGQDTVHSTLFNGKIFWIFGDTNLPAYPLGVFKATGATSLLPAQGGLEPQVGVDLDYFSQDGVARAIAPVDQIPNPPGHAGFLATWLSGLTAVGAAGSEQLFAIYGLFDSSRPTAHQEGFARWNGQAFAHVLTFAEDLAVRPAGHAFRFDSDGFVYYGESMRIPASDAALLDPSRYEAFSPLVTGSSTVLDRDPQGRVRYAWRRQTPFVTLGMVWQGVALAGDEQLFGKLRDFVSGRGFSPAQVSTAWNPYRGRFTQIVQEYFGVTSAFGEIWYAEADTPVGPWVYARQIVTSDNYTFYNPEQHPFFAQAGGRTIYFQATHTAWATSPAATPMPRDDYNQLMYRLELTDERLVLPVPVYDLSAASLPGDFVTKAGLRPGMQDVTASFFALDRPGPGSIPVYWSGAACTQRVLHAGGSPATEPVFHALPADVPSPPPGTVPLYEYVNATTAQRAYSIEPVLALPGFVRVSLPLARVWANPMARAILPVTAYLPDLVADAGADQCAQEDGRGRGAVIVLDASRSRGAALSYRWSWDRPHGRRGRSKLANPELHLPAGRHNVRLTIERSDGQTSSDTVVVDVAPL